MSMDRHFPNSARCHYYFSKTTVFNNKTEWIEKICKNIWQIIEMPSSQKQVFISWICNLKVESNEEILKLPTIPKNTRQEKRALQPPCQMLAYKLTFAADLPFVSIATSISLEASDQIQMS